MSETEPLYFKEFKEDIKRHIDVSINDLALMIQNNFVTKDELQEMKDDIRGIESRMATKEDVKEILSHIGRYEIRAQNTEDIVLKDHKPRIVDLEKEVFA